MNKNCNARFSIGPVFSANRRNFYCSYAEGHQFPKKHKYIGKNFEIVWEEFLCDGG